ncbi:MAG: CopD family protein [Magnetococcales bacterium]|nr:CopD family protein [Magnetococcales bacterium]
MSYYMAVHLVSAVIWVGGMFFAHMVLRPASLALEVPERVQLWFGVLNRFFPWVWLSVVLLPLTGYIMALVEFDSSMADLGLHIHIMQGLGIIMILLFLYVFFVPFQTMRKRVSECLFPEAGMYMNRIRIAVTINLVLGLLVTLVASAGRYW